MKYSPLVLALAGAISTPLFASADSDSHQRYLIKYKNNQFTKVSKLIAQSITDAKKLIVKKKKR